MRAQAVTAVNSCVSSLRHLVSCCARYSRLTLQEIRLVSHVRTANISWVGNSHTAASESTRILPQSKALSVAEQVRPRLTWQAGVFEGEIAKATSGYVPRYGKRSR